MNYLPESIKYVSNCDEMSTAQKSELRNFCDKQYMGNKTNVFLCIANDYWFNLLLGTNLHKILLIQIPISEYRSSE